MLHSHVGVSIFRVGDVAWCREGELADVSENQVVRRMKVLVLPVLLVAIWLMLAPSTKATPGDRVPSPTDVRSPSLPLARLEAPAGHRKVEVDGVSLDMTEAQALTALKVSASRDAGARLVLNSEGRVKGVVDGKSIRIEGHEPIRIGARRESLFEALGFPKSQEPGLAGCGLDSTTCWLYPVEGGGLRVYIYRDRHDTVEIEPHLRSTMVAFDLSDTLYGSFRRP